MDHPVHLTIDGQEHALTLDVRTTLLDALRDHLGTMSAKKGCDHGQCGACTVLVDGRRMNSCLLLAVTLDGAEVTTSDGLADGEELPELHRAFLDHDAFQCGYCTPGQICSAAGVLTEAAEGRPSVVTDDPAHAAGGGGAASGERTTSWGTATTVGQQDAALDQPVELTDEEIRERMSGNLCRCGAYAGIVDAVRQAAAQEQR